VEPPLEPEPPVEPPRRADRPPRRLEIDERLVAAALPLVVALALVAGTNALRSEIRRASYLTQRTAFGTAVRLAHLRWMAGSARGAGVVRLSKRHSVVVNDAGWPTIDPDHPAQDSARELWRALMDRPLGDAWRAGALAARGGGTARFTLGGPGGGSFVYDARDGSVRLDPERGERPRAGAQGFKIRHPAADRGEGVPRMSGERRGDLW
jgi:hypothetical protein